MENPSPRCVGPKASELCTSESHAPPHACTSFPLSGRQLSKNQTPAAISTRLLRTLLPKPPDASLGESWPRGAMKWKRPEQRRESRRGRRRWWVLFLSSCSLCSVLHNQSFYQTVNAEPRVSKHHTRKIEG